MTTETYEKNFLTKVLAFGEEFSLSVSGAVGVKRGFKVRLLP